MCGLQKKGTLLDIILLLTLGTADGMCFGMIEITDIGHLIGTNNLIFLGVTMETLWNIH